MCRECSTSPQQPNEFSDNNDLIALPGMIVTLELALTPENGFVPESLFDMSGTVSFMLQWGNYLPGLHELALHKRIGDTVHGVSIDAGWGERRSDLLLTVPLAKLQAVSDKQRTHPAAAAATPSFRIGTRLSLNAGSIDVAIVAIDTAAGTVTLDANSPLAGASYACSFTVVAIHPMPRGLIGTGTTGSDCTFDSSEANNDSDHKAPFQSDGRCTNDRFQVATFALGCFWGAELAFMRTVGVVGTRVGYTQGTTAHPTYEQVCAGTTHHREAMQVIYDAKVVSYHDLVQVALERLRSTWSSTQSSLELHRLFREGSSDVDDAKQYRHGFFYHSTDQRIVAHGCIDPLNKFGIELMPAVTFWKAEEWHQQYLYKGGQSARKGSTEIIRCYG